MTVSADRDVTHWQHPMRLDGICAIVTGGASGIGLASAKLLAACGAKVVIADRQRALATEAANQIRNATSAQVDVTSSDQVEALFAEHPDVGILVNSAGIAKRHAAVDHPLDDWEQVAAVNMTGTFLCARAAARQMIAADRNGSIVNIASIMGLSGGGIYPNVSYQTTKGAVVNMTRALAIEWAAHRIRVNAVAPTYVRTPFIAPLLAQPELVARIEAMTPLGDFATPDDIANAVLYLASGASRMVTGHILPVDGGFLAQ
ncbi:SDR family oxidoreductase [Devosia algicola]|uniref:SDR family oxidoreductase n=1 Tax=Devosia algicola TaxID=3026418 RepID=A0ABY7YLN7_9HYPH|nr:SDR family oxidoreductase [Devosia algicola]WDR02176.1 SDR family oxidoreductase [Devosia algicola]